MTIKIKKITYLIPPKDLLHDALDVLVDLESDSEEFDEFGYVLEITTPQFLSIIMEKEKSAFLSPDYPSIIVSKLTDDVIRAAIESFINSDEKLYWLKLYHILPSLEMEDVNKLYDRKKQESIELEAKVEVEFEAQSDTND